MSKLYSTRHARAFDSGISAAFDLASIKTIISKDDITKRSPDSAAMLEYWNLTDDIVTGAKAIREKGEVYFPKFSDETASEYKNRLNYTKFTNVYRDIVENLASKPFEEEISIVTGDDKLPPGEIVDFVEDVDGAGNNLTVFAASTFFNGINSAIDWIFVDYPTVDPSKIRTRAEEKNAGVRPFWSHVLGRNVLEAKVRVINGKETLIYMRILEPGMLDRVRIFQRHDNGTVSWLLYEQKPSDDKNSAVEFILVGYGMVTINAIPLVPFYTGRRDGRTFKFWPAMRDAADLQIELYIEESGLKFSKTMGGYSMLAANGIAPQMEADGKTPKRLAVGPNRVLYSKPDGAGNIGSWGYVQPDASVMKFLSEDIKNTKQDLRELGRQPLTAQSGNLTVITTAVAAGKTKSAVAAWGLILKNALEEALLLTSLWLNIPEKQYSPEVEVYDGYDALSENTADLDALKNMRATGDLSQTTLWSEMKRRKVLSSEFDAAAEQDRLNNEVPGDDLVEDDIDRTAPVVE